MSFIIFHFVTCIWNFLTQNALISHGLFGKFVSMEVTYLYSGNALIMFLYNTLLLHSGLWTHTVAITIYVQQCFKSHAVF